MVTTKKKKRAVTRLVGPVGEFAFDTLRALKEHADLLSKVVHRLTDAEAGIKGAWARDDKMDARITALEAALFAPVPSYPHGQMDKGTECPRVGDVIQTEAHARALPVGSQAVSGKHTYQKAACAGRNWSDVSFGVLDLFDDGEMVRCTVTRVGPAAAD
jgi:hypothetical protein